MGSHLLLSPHALLLPPSISSPPPPPKLALPPRSHFCSSVLPFSRLSISAVATSKPSMLFGRVSTRASADDGVETASSAAAEAAEGDVEAEAKPPRKPIVKLGDIMGILHKRAIEASENARPVPDIRTGDIVEIKLEVPENRRRASIYKGIVISKQNAGIHTTIRIRRIIAGLGVEIVFPVHSPNIKEIKVVSHRKVRRARLYYLREKLPRLSTFK